ncbi:hypothetical protein V8F20_011415 [Naviculisporaceae sp. PSN 640]
MSQLRLEVLPDEISDMIARTFVTEPAGFLSEYHVPARTSAIGTTAERMMNYIQNRRNLRELCRTNKHFLSIARVHEYEHVIITTHSSLYLLFRTMILVPPLADRIKTIECNINLDAHIGPNFMPVLMANPLLSADWYDGLYNGKPVVDFIYQRLGEAFMADWVFNQSFLLTIKNPSIIFFLGILALATNLRTLTITYPQRYVLPPHIIEPLIEGRSQMMCAASVNNRNGQGPAPLQKLETIRFRRFLAAAIDHVPHDVPAWLSDFMKLPQVTKLEIAGLTHPQLDPNPNLPVVYNGLRAILTSPQVSNITRLELVFDVYHDKPVKSWLSPVLLGLRGTLKHLSVTFFGDTDSYNFMAATGSLQWHQEIMKHDRIDSLPKLNRLEHLEVDLHSLFGWARLWSLNDQSILDEYPERANSIYVRDTIPTQSLQTLHLIETFVDIDIFLNILAPDSTTNSSFINGSLVLNNLGSLDHPEDKQRMAAARRKIQTHVWNDLLLLVQQGGLPSLKKFVYTPITHARVEVECSYNTALDQAVRDFAQVGVEMEVVYAGQLGRVCVIIHIFHDFTSEGQTSSWVGDDQRIPGVNYTSPKIEINLRTLSIIQAFKSRISEHSTRGLGNFSVLAPHFVGGAKTLGQAKNAKHIQIV